MEPFEHFKENRRTEICVRGRVGPVNRMYVKERASRYQYKLGLVGAAMFDQ